MAGDSEKRMRESMGIVCSWQNASCELSEKGKRPPTMDLRGCKTTKQGLLGSPLVAHGISLGVFHEFSDSLCASLGEIEWI
jgi:hypothetical protein